MARRSVGCARVAWNADLKANRAKIARGGWQCAAPRDFLQKDHKRAKDRAVEAYKAKKAKKRAEKKHVKAHGMGGGNNTEDEDEWEMSDDEEGDEMLAFTNTFGGK